MEKSAFGFIRKWLRVGRRAPRKERAVSPDLGEGEAGSDPWRFFLDALLRVRYRFLDFALKSAIPFLVLLLFFLGSFRRVQYIGLILFLWFLALSARLSVLVYMVYTGSVEAGEGEEEE